MLPGQYNWYLPIVKSDCKFMCSRKSVSIIIPNYNGKHLLKAYLNDTIVAAENARVEYEIIVVDDCSTDDSYAFVLSNFPGIKLLRNNENRGFSYSCNQGLKVAKYELVLLLNSDVKLTPDYFRHQWHYFSQPDTFGVMGRIMGVDKTTIEDAARYIDINGAKIKATKFFYSKNPNDLIPTTYLSGANALIDKKKLLEIGGFDEIFSPFYSEDFELGLRAWRLNWKCYYEHRSVCYHHVMASTSRYKTKQWVKYIYYRNKFLLHAIHLNGAQLYLWYLQLVFMEVIPKLLLGRFWIVKSYIAFVKHSKEIQNSKRKLALLMEKHDSNLSISDVMRNFRKPLVQEDLIWL